MWPKESIFYAVINRHLSGRPVSPMMCWGPGGPLQMGEHHPSPGKQAPSHRYLSACQRQGVTPGGRGESAEMSRCE